MEEVEAVAMSADLQWKLPLHIGQATAMGKCEQSLIRISLNKQCIKKYAGKRSMPLQGFYAETYCAVRQQPQGATVIAPANRSTNGIDYSPMILTMIVLGFLWIGSFFHLVVCAGN